MLEPCASTPDAPAADTAVSPDDLNRIVAPARRARLADHGDGDRRSRRPDGRSTRTSTPCARIRGRNANAAHRLEHAAFIDDDRSAAARPAERDCVASADAGRTAPGPHRRGGAQRRAANGPPARGPTRARRRRGEPARVRNRLAGRAAEPDGRDPRRRQPDHRGRTPRRRLESRRAAAAERAIDAFTSGPAYASFDEQRKGSLKVGMLADLVVLSTDIFDAPPSRLASTTVAVTIFDGKIVYRRSASVDQLDTSASAPDLNSSVPDADAPKNSAPDSQVSGESRGLHPASTRHPPWIARTL